MEVPRWEKGRGKGSAKFLILERERASAKTWSSLSNCVKNTSDGVS